MTRLQRLNVRSAIAVVGGLVIGLSIVGVLEHRSGLPSGPAATERPGPATTGVSPTQSPAAMTLHDSPRPIAELRFEEGDGTPLTLADFRGKVVLLNIWATWCGPCRAEMPTLDRLQATLGEQDFEVLALSIDRVGMTVVDRFYAEIGVKHLGRYIDVSAKVARDLGAYGLPTTLLVDRDGREIARHVGPAEWDTPSMKAFFRKQLGREASAVRPATTTKVNKEGASS